MKNLISKLFATKPRARKAAAPRRLGVESLGQRIVPAALTYRVEEGKGIGTITSEAGESADVRVLSFVCPVNGPSIRIIDKGEIKVETRAFNVDRLEFFGGSNDDKFVNDTDKPAVMRGGAGNDTLTGGNVVDVIFGGEGDDLIVGRAGNDQLNGEGGHDSITGGEGNDVLTGGTGNDRLEGGSGGDQVRGDAGSDVFVRASMQNPAAGWSPFSRGSWFGPSTASRTVQVGDDVETQDRFDTRATPTDPLAAQVDEVIRLANLERTSRGLAALQVDTRLMNAAAGHAQTMARLNQLDHNAGGTDVGVRMSQAGYNFTEAGENIAHRYSTAAEAVQAWMASTEGHREAILSTSFVHVGVGVAQASDGTMYYCMVFGRP